MTIQAMKRTLRQRIIADRAALPHEERARLSGEITAQLLRLPSYSKAHTVLGYVNFGAEFESEAWIRQALHDGKGLLLPKVNRVTHELDLYRVTDVDTQLAPGAFGIREPLPQKCVAANLEEADFILLPGVAFGRDGSRLGYGGGFYDKLLARLNHKPTLVAAAYAIQLAEDIPQEATDQKIDCLVTEKEIIQCGARASCSHDN